MKALIRSVALEAGFDDVGFASAGSLIQDRERLTQWLVAGRHGEMTWMARDPDRRAMTSAWVRTVIALTHAYAPLKWEPGEKKYAAYAEGDDYHRFLKPGLDAICRVIRERGGRARRFVDTGAVLERAWAERAGVGFIGRNMMLISRTRGPSVYLSTIFTDLEIPADDVGTGTCGSCTKCLDACPTLALDETGLDARKCISYLTIEVKRPLTETEQAMTGDWVFGCDDCVTACPYTVRSLPAIRPERRGVTRYKTAG